MQNLSVFNAEVHTNNFDDLKRLIVELTKAIVDLQNKIASLENEIRQLKK